MCGFDIVSKYCVIMNAWICSESFLYIPLINMTVFLTYYLHCCHYSNIV